MGKGGQRVVPVKPVPPAQSEWISPYDPKDSNTSLPSVGQIKSVIPAHCFERSYFWSTYYVFRDTAWAVGCVYITSQLLSTDIPSESIDLVKWVLGWSAYIFSMGTIMFGPWILGHECGHGAFSPSQTFNDCFGFILHHIVLVPYFAWQYSHAKHHRRVNHLVDGESHVPSVKRDVGLSENNERQHYLALMHELSNLVFTY
jgi:fatty acid desaturase